MIRFLKTWKLDDIEKRPLVVVIAFLFTALIYVVSRSDERESRDRSETRDCQEKYDDLVISLLQKNNIINDLDAENHELKKQITDSTVRAETNEPIKGILK